MEHCQKNKNLENKVEKKGILKGKTERNYPHMHVHSERAARRCGASDGEAPLRQAFPQEGTRSHDVGYFLLCDIGKENKCTQNSDSRVGGDRACGANGTLCCSY